MKVYFIRRHKRFFILSQKLQLIWQWNAHLEFKIVPLLTYNSICSWVPIQKRSPVYSKAPSFAKCLQFIHSDDNNTNALSSIFACLYLCSKSGKHKSASSSSNCSSNYSPVKWLWKKKCAFLQQKPSLWDIVFLSNVNHPRATTWAGLLSSCITFKESIRFWAHGLIAKYSTSPLKNM